MVMLKKAAFEECLKSLKTKYFNVRHSGLQSSAKFELVEFTIMNSSNKMVEMYFSV